MRSLAVGTKKMSTPQAKPLFRLSGVRSFLRFSRPSQTFPSRCWVWYYSKPEIEKVKLNRWLLSMTSCNLEVKTLKGQIVLLSDVPIESTIQSIYERVHEIETTPDGKWKLMIITTSLRTLKWSERDRPLVEF